MISNRASPYSEEHDIKRKPTSQFDIMFSFTIQKSSDFLIILYQIFRKRTIYMSSVADLQGAKAPCPVPPESFFQLHAVFVKNIGKQECIPVGCVSPAAAAVCLWGGGECQSQCMLGYTPLGLGLDTPPKACGPGHTPRCGLEHPPGCGPGHPPGQTPQPPPWVWA